MTVLSTLPIRFHADPPGRPPLLLLHGFLSSRNHWRLNEPALRRRYRLILAELPGHGATPGCTDPEALTPDALADCLEAGRKALAIDRWHLCGQSFGAGIALRHALRHPASVGALIWTNANRVLSPPMTPEEIADQLARADRLEAGGVEALRRERFHPRFARRFPPEMRELLSRDADGGDIATYARLIRHATIRMTLRDRIKDLAMPVLLMNGRLESGFQPARDLAAQLLPVMEIADLEGGHSVNIEAATAFDDAALAFLSCHDDLLLAPATATDDCPRIR